MLGLDDKLIIALGVVALLVLWRIIFWLHKIYRRVRQIAKLIVHFIEEKKK